MSDNEFGGRRKRRGNRAAGCAGCGCGVPILLAMGAAVLYVNRNQPPDIVIPTPKVPINNAYDDFVVAGRMSTNMTYPGPSSVGGTASNNPKFAPSQTLAYQAHMAQEAATPLALLHSSLNKPYLAPPTRSFNVQFPEYASMRNLARTTADTARYYDRIGQRDRAIDILLDGYEMGAMLPKGGVLITGLVGVALEAINVKPLDPLIPKLTPKQLDHIAIRLDRIAAKQVNYGDILREERDATTAGELELFRKSKGGGFSGLAQISGDNGGGNQSAQPPKLDQLVMGARFAFADKNRMLRENMAYYDALANEARQPYTGPSRLPMPNNVLAQMMSPVFEQARLKFLSMEAVTALLRTETALYRYRAAKNRFPSALDDLASERDAQGKPFLAPVPTDPYGGKPLRYALTNGGKSFVLYSIGDNLKDDGGLPSKSPGETGFGDIVAGKLFAPKYCLTPNQPALPSPTSGRPSTERDHRRK